MSISDNVNVNYLKPAAVKSISRGAQNMKSLRTEIAALLKVKGHPNIVSLYDVYVGMYGCGTAFEVDPEGIRHYQ